MFWSRQAVCKVHDASEKGGLKRFISVERNTRQKKCRITFRYRVSIRDNKLVPLYLFGGNRSKFLWKWLYSTSWMNEYNVRFYIKKRIFLIIHNLNNKSWGSVHENKPVQETQHLTTIKIRTKEMPILIPT